MIIKGKSRAGPVALANHLGNAEANERVRLLESRGVVSTDLRGALVEMDALAIGTRCQKSLYHAAISPEPPHRLTPEQRTEAIDALEQKLGLDGHQRVVVLHEKLGREHIHVVWSRIDQERMRSVSDSHNYRKHEETARELERRFGHDRVQGAHAERNGPDGKTERPNRTPTRAELRQEERTGIKGKEVKAEVTAMFRASDKAESFKAALEHRGYTLARGDRRDYVVIDQAGGIHSLARRIEGVKAKDLRAFMSPLDVSNIPDVTEARLLKIDERRRRREESIEDRLERTYSQGADYVTQSRAALKEYKRRQAELDRLNRKDPLLDRINSGEALRSKLKRKETEERTRREQERSSTRESPVSAREDLPVRGDIELTDAMQTRLSRLREVKAESPAGLDPGRQNGASSQGQARGRSA